MRSVVVIVVVVADVVVVVVTIVDVVFVAVVAVAGDVEFCCWFCGCCDMESWLCRCGGGRCC